MALTEKHQKRTASTEQRTSWSWKRLFGKDDSSTNAASAAPITPEADTPRSEMARRLSRKVVPGLPRPGTFKRQQSELRDRLEPAKPNQEERRTVSVGRRGSLSCRESSSAVANPQRLSAPDLLETAATIDTVLHVSKRATAAVPEVDALGYVEISKDEQMIDTRSMSSGGFDEVILAELERRWILNLSMHFRDKSRREKFFVTFAETPTHWRRVTISLDYRNVAKGSLEEELQRTRFQRNKSARIFEAIRESLSDIQFYDTVTNLKLQTENERLHVHVVEDLSEIISYPSVRAIRHLDCRRVRENQLEFDSHLSGFVYKVRLGDEKFIKKEIPGPDTVDEFLYEINALHQLSGSRSVIQFGGVVLDIKGEVVKGLLISYAEQGALIDVIFDGDGRIPWKRRERWARQIVEGLSEIHEAGFVQGDFTLSNIVIDADDNAKIIDINRRGCPVGWEPPEVAVLIDSDQRISMYIGVKSDLFQLGMVLYALATQQDEPETLRPLNWASLPDDIPEYYLDVCYRCLNDDPRCRSQAVTLLGLFPASEDGRVVEVKSIPVVIDVRHVDEDFPLEHSSRLRWPNGSATTESDEEEYVPRRGRSSQRATERQNISAWELPLPPSRAESQEAVVASIQADLDIEAANTTCTVPGENCVYQQHPEPVNHNSGAQSIPELMSSQSQVMTVARLPTYPEELAGVGVGVGEAINSKLHKANVNGDFTTDMYHDSFGYGNPKILEI